MDGGPQFHRLQTTIATPPSTTTAVATTSGHCSGKTAGRRGAIVFERHRRHTPCSMGTLTNMQDAFGIVLFVVVAVALVAAIYAASGSGALYKQIGRGGLSLDRDDDAPRRTLSGAVAQAVADEEIRQMLGARNARREARGEAPLDVDAELARLTAPAAADPALEAEVRSLVIARNARRERQGKPPLDVEAEIRRQLSDLS